MNTDNLFVELVIPCQAELVTVARLVASSMANRLELPYDRIQYCKIAVSEVCNDAIDRAETAGCTNGQIRMKFYLAENKLTIRMEDNIPDSHTAPSEMTDEQELRREILKNLVDELQITRSPNSGITTTMVVKNADVASGREQPDSD
jgi:serine/threonine-protein kinase RsbW